MSCKALGAPWSGGWAGRFDVSNNTRRFGEVCSLAGTANFPQFWSSNERLSTQAARHNRYDPADLVSANKPEARKSPLVAISVVQASVVCKIQRVVAIHSRIAQAMLQGASDTSGQTSGVPAGAPGCCTVSDMDSGTASGTDSTDATSNHRSRQRQCVVTRSSSGSHACHAAQAADSLLLQPGLAMPRLAASADICSDTFAACSLRYQEG